MVNKNGIGASLFKRKLLSTTFQNLYERARYPADNRKAKHRSKTVMICHGTWWICSLLVCLEASLVIVDWSSWFRPGYGFSNRPDIFLPCVLGSQSACIFLNVTTSSSSAMFIYPEVPFDLVKFCDILCVCMVSCHCTTQYITKKVFICYSSSVWSLKVWKLFDHYKILLHKAGISAASHSDHINLENIFNSSKAHINSGYFLRNTWWHLGAKDENRRADKIKNVLFFL